VTALPPAGARARLIAWCLYDWAYGPFNTIVTTFVFATYFVQAVAPDPIRGTTEWGTAQAIAGLIVAAIAAPLGAIADHGGRRHALLRVTCTGALWFIRPQPGFVLPALLLAGIATVAYEVALTFYNAMLPEVAAHGQIGRVSGIAWGLGYLGGIAALLLSLFVLLRPVPPPFGLDPVSAEPVRATMLLVSVWLLAFAAPLLLLREIAVHRLPWMQAARRGLAGFAAIVRAAAREPVLRRFLIARMLYGDGLITLFAFGAIFAAGTFGMDAQRVLLLGIGLNVTAGVGAFAFALLEDRVGPRSVVLTSLVCLLALGTAVLAVRDVGWFWAAALPLGLFVGPAQSASRSLMAQLAPPDRRASFFGLYALSGRVTGFIGPASLAVVTAATGSQRAGMCVVLVLLGAGAWLLAGVQIASPVLRTRTST
jgi:MFS transporter, UMF1 family